LRGTTIHLTLDAQDEEARMSARRETVTAHPPAVSCGPLSSTVVRGGDFLFVAGLSAVDPNTGQPLRGTTAAETRQILESLRQLLEASGSSLDKMVKVNVLLASMLEAPNMNDVYARFFSEPPPARTVCGARLPDGVKVIIECTALA
jgi:2-iminobutanoate/2-iminopropanoate deaminase